MTSSNSSRTSLNLLINQAIFQDIEVTTNIDSNMPEMIGDLGQIQQVLTNLLVNSIKYGQLDGTTEVSVENLIKNKVIVRVTDNGEGIEEEHLTRLFERFYRVDKSGSRRSEGARGPPRRAAPLHRARHGL